MTEDVLAYQILDGVSLPGLIADIGTVRELLGGSPHDWRSREVGDGNLNLVFIVQGPRGSVCLKQALPYVRAAGPSWPMSPERTYFEHAYFRAVAPHVGAQIPRVYHYDHDRHFIIMECLSPHVILRQGLIAGHSYPRAARDIGEYIARACFFTSDFAVPFERKLEDVSLFARNTPLIRITVDLVFCEPYYEAVRNRHTSPQLDGIAAELRANGALKAAAARLGRKFLSEPQALVHGDLHSGSVMVTEHDSRVIDPEFAFYGPIGFDLGAFLANLLLSYYSQFGHATSEEDRSAQRAWLLEQMETLWTSFRRVFLAVWADHALGDAFPVRMFGAPADAAALELARCRFLDTVFADTVGFAACKMIRRILGFAHVLDFEAIRDADLRARCEAAALRMAAALLENPDRFTSMAELIDSVPRWDPSVGSD
jgi:5-methylthioribose kinase